MGVKELLGLLGLQVPYSLCLVHTSEEPLRDSDAMLTTDLLSTPRHIMKAYPRKSLLGIEVRLEVWRHATKKSYGKVAGVALDKGVALLGVRVQGLVDGYCVDAGDLLMSIHQAPT